MNKKQSELIRVVMEMIDGTIDTMEQDEFHAPAKWVLENWWHTLNAVLQIRNHADSKPNSFKATDEAESKKTDKNIQSHQ